MKSGMRRFNWAGSSLLFLVILLTHDSLYATPANMLRAPADVMENLVAGKPQELVVLFDDGAIARETAIQRAQSGAMHDTPAILEFKRGRYKTLKQRVFSTLPAAEYTTLRDYSHVPMALIRFRSTASLERLLSHTDVKAVYKNSKLYHHLTESLALINQPVSASYSGSNTTVVVLDTGVDYTDAAFGYCSAPGVPATCKVSVSQDLATDDGALDDSGHGTNVAGIVVGVASNTRIAALDVFVGTSTSVALIIEGINWAISNQAAYDITAINMSLGDGGRYTSPCGNRGTNPFLIPIENAINAGIMVVASSGNEQYLDGITSPACTPGVVSVGAVYDANVGSRSWTVCTDSTTAADQLACFSNSAYYLTLLAPGALITSAGYTMAGTSQAAPHVAGAIAILRSAFPNESLDNIVLRMTGNSVLVSDPRNNVTTPRLDLAALNVVLDEDIPTLEEWGVITMGILLLIIMLTAERRRFCCLSRQVVR